VNGAAGGAGARAAARRGRSLVWPVAAAILLATLAGGLGQALVVVAVMGPLEKRDARARAEIALGALQQTVAALPAAPHGESLRPLLERVRREAGLRAALVFRDARGRVTWSRPDLARFARREGPGAGRRGPAARAPDTLATRAITHGGRVLGHASALRFHAPGRGLRPPTGETLLLSLPIALLAALGTAFLVVRWLVARLRRIERLAARVADGDLTARVADRSGDEIGRLAERLDHMTASLAAARARLEAQDAQRRQLFADITHELATPLTSVRGYTETLLDPAVRVSDEERERYLRGILEESRRLDRMTRDLFDLARLEAGAAPLERERLDWAALCRNVVERFAPRFEAAGLALRWEGGAREAWVEADGHRVVQVIENLLANALRHVPRGGTVAVAVEAGGADAPRHRLTVRDDGPGVPAEDLPHLFERFYRAAAARRSATHDEAGGSGLGLAIVREITERHGGAVRARAAEPRGLAIEVELPAAAPPSV